MSSNLRTYESIESYDNLPMDTKLELARGVDFLSPLSFQAGLRGDQEAFHFEGHVSITGNTSVEEEMSDDVVDITHDKTTVDRYFVEAGAPNPHNRRDAKFDVVSLSEIYASVCDLCGAPDIMTTELGIMHTPNGSNWNNITSLDGVDNVAEMKTSRGSQPTRDAQKTGMKLMNPNDHRRDELLDLGVITSNQVGELSKRARSTLVTDWVWGNTGLTHDGFTSNFDLQRMFLNFQHGEILQDIAVPEAFTPNNPTVDNSVHAYHVLGADGYMFL